jgi:N-acetylglucosaminyldiphosphoundecaprenol N-acetyl-beta-D-mannosaminyltransferase
MLDSVETDVKKINVVEIFGLPINSLTMEEVLALCEKHIIARRQVLLGVINAAKIVNAQRDLALRQSLQQADLILADGMPIVWLSKLLGKALPERVAGIDLMYGLIERACRNSYSVYFLGAKPEVVTKVVEHVASKHPGTRIAGFRDGYFNESQEEGVAEQIRASNADILFVGMNSPKKENFLRKWHRHMLVPVCHGVGGSFDVMAGVAKRAPVWMQKGGLEWFYRFVQEPHRMWKRYLFTNTMFLALSLQAIIKSRISKLAS